MRALTAEEIATPNKNQPLILQRIDSVQKQVHLLMMALTDQEQILKPVMGEPTTAGDSGEDEDRGPDDEVGIALLKLEHLVAQQVSRVRHTSGRLRVG